MNLRLTKAIPALLLLLLILVGCARTDAAPPSARPWPTHAPEATPYVRLMSEAAPKADEEYADFSWDAIYERFGSFYARKDELELFRALPQDEPYSFVPHSARFVLDEGEALRMAELFDGQEGCQARVIAMHQITDGLDDWGFLTVVDCTPARLFELSGEISEQFMFEQFYPAVRERFDVDYWPDGLYAGTEAALKDYEVRGCLCFEPETLARLEGLDRDAVCDFAMQVYTPGGWSRDANDMLSVLRGREGVELKLLYQENAVPSESLCVASMTLSRLSVLSGELRGHYLVRIADDTLRAAYDGAVRLRVGPDGDEVAEVTEP
ncbi:MAG: hypothetical protein Q4E45_04235 [Eubacteriales bacterium]|nr:hypothetical protein [Eubacteriales bacterium]